MANDEHIARLNEGTEFWNTWVGVQATKFEADLSDANLSGRDLGGANFANTNLIGASLIDTNLVEANLTGAYLTRAHLNDAHLTGATLSGANLMGANISGANLIGADLVDANLTLTNLFCVNLTNANLTRAKLTGADISRAELVGANLTGAFLCETEVYETLFIDTDFSDASGVESIWHQGPSTIDHRTIQKSLPPLPQEFLRECGLSPWQIECTKLLQPELSQAEVDDIGYNIIRLRGQQPIQLYSLFISHSSQDKLFANRLYDDLQANGVNCWLAENDLKIGERFRDRIDEAIHLHDKLLVILSSHSVASQWVENEVETALDKEGETNQSVLFPIKIDHAVDTIKRGWALAVKRRHIGDFTHCDREEDYKAAFKHVLRGLRAE